jgi:hypothetical protein
MNKTRQLWALLKFQVTINPVAIVFPLVMVAPYYIPLIIRPHSYLPGFAMSISNQNLFFVGFVGVMLLAPEIMRSAATSAAWPTGTEFLLTRAVDRYLVLRARTIFFYVLVLAIPLFALVAALSNPSLQIREYDKVSHQQILDHIAGSATAPADRNERTDIITIPNGKALVEGWHAWQFLSLAIGTQLFILLIYPLKYGRYILWTTYLGLIFVPLLTIMSIGYKRGGASPSEAMFFAFVAHQPLFWMITIAALLLGHLWCERRFAGLEH